MKKTKRDPIVLGKKKEGEKPKRKFRVLVQERLSTKTEIESMTSFMIHDYKGKTKVKSIVDKMSQAIGGK